MNNDDIFNSGENQEQATFLIQFRGFNNTTWQGTVTWMDKKKTLQFRSALELLSLIQETQEDSGVQWSSLEE